MTKREAIEFVAELRDYVKQNRQRTERGSRHWDRTRGWLKRIDQLDRVIKQS